LDGVRVTQSLVIDRAALLSAAREASPELRRLRAQLTAARESRVEAGSTRLPRLQLGARVQEFASSNGFSSSEWQTGMQVSYPVFTGGATSAAAQRAAAETSAAVAEIELAEQRIAESIDRAAALYESSRARVTALADAEAQQREVARIELLALTAGSGVQTDFLNAEAELFRIRAAATFARADELRARIELARVTGALSPAWLTTNIERIP
ncbi:MAG: TolC family protein, partial [Longimicrobiales bacterium]